jgi:glycosyltransferase involved in cell wall biosynthesis
VSSSANLSATVLICTYNRADLLDETLTSLRAVRASRIWDIVVVDNNSSDNTREVVERHAASFHVPVTWVFEPAQGKSFALNTGIAQSRGEIIVFTDDDVVVAENWLEAACAPMDADGACQYTGGPVDPIWEVEPPRWLDRTRGDLWGTLAILDYGPEPFVFEERKRVPLGANMAVRRALIDRIGGFHPALGRRGRSLMGQEQAEFFSRARDARARGRYAPEMRVQHHVPRVRLTKQYFRRWWFWKGISRARVDILHRRTELGLDLTGVPHIAGVPRYVWGQLPRSAGGWLKGRVTGDVYAAARHEMAVLYGLGYIRGCWSAPITAPLERHAFPRQHQCLPLDE